jgi:hypothetical protein
MDGASWGDARIILALMEGSKVVILPRRTGAVCALLGELQCDVVGQDKPGRDVVVMVGW